MNAVDIADHPTIDGDRLWRSLMEMARFGATEKGGVCRLAASDADRDARDRFIEWCKQAGCTVRVDAMGNILARRPGRSKELLPVGAGSHLDSQPTGGRFDGALGVMAALEVVRTLNDRGIETERPIEICAWTDEEGARFAPAMLGSGVFAGVFDLDYGHGRADHEGVSLGEALERIGYRGELPPGFQQFAAFFELHIEQGPVLENAATSIGVVTGVQGMRWYDLTITGSEAHAGSTPMEMRSDALQHAATLLPDIYRLATSRAPQGRATVGELEVRPGSRNTVPGQVRLTVDLRHPDAQILDRMDEGLRTAVSEHNRHDGIRLDLDHLWTSDPIAFHPTCTDSLRQAAARCGCSHVDIVSGAGHDAVNIARVAPVGMIFVPCEGGISHNESEYATPEDTERGANVLLLTVLDHALNDDHSAVVQSGG